MKKMRKGYFFGFTKGKGLKRDCHIPDLKARSQKQNGYAEVRRDGKKIRLHRWAWETANGPIPKGMYVMHTCDNPECINPEHLKIGFPHENVADMVSRGRAGWQSGKFKLAKLSDWQVGIIRDSDMKPKDLAERFGVTASNIRYIKRGETWKQISAVSPKDKETSEGRVSKAKK